ncbi:carbohydrate/purine kinase domain-containing protein [Tieghemostelium lacteum]|uniref:Carbohydrate/purine kinase domain-containing protein n=1 Tax=Tieghemostelium lacteum TaxID=361077 RepID=A0A151ZIW0_TIELA|nr:carbohydrate/purine kinase domain-containing protein [Tieghemostelium lacteum]|eukprot:KYQ93903.1 carbohydrate/purine kinase domain-containing protein [Tieghemostelium lacteum]
MKTKIQIFGTVCLDKIRFIESFPNRLGSYTEVKKESLYLGGEASNSFVCLGNWLIDEQNKNQNVQLKLISVPLVNDDYGKWIKSHYLFQPFILKNSDLVSLDVMMVKDDKNEFTSTPCCDLYVCNQKERTMFGIGYKESENYAIRHQKEVLFDRLEFLGERYWVTFDYNTPTCSDLIIKKSIETLTNLLVLDHPFDFNQSDIAIDNLSRMNIIYQISTDYTDTKNDKSSTIQHLNNWLSNGNNKYCLMVLTDGANGFVIGGQIYNLKTKTKETVPTQWFDTYKITDVIDTIGSGDCFRAGLLYSIALHDYIALENLQEIMKFASASGGLNCKSIGGCTRTPTLSEIHQLQSTSSLL